MLLSLSSQLAGFKADIDRAVNPGVGGVEEETGVPHGQLLQRFALALHSRFQSDLEAVREEVIREMGREALVDAAGVVAQFEAINRVADATGTRIDDMIGQAMKIGMGPSKLPEPERY